MENLRGKPASSLGPPSLVPERHHWAAKGLGFAAAVELPGRQRPALGFVLSAGFHAAFCELQTCIRRGPRRRVFPGGVFSQQKRSTVRAAPAGAYSVRSTRCWRACFGCFSKSGEDKTLRSVLLCSFPSPLRKKHLNSELLTAPLRES